MAAHDLRGPLTSILGYSDLLREGDADDDEAQEYLLVIRKDAQRMVRLVDDLLVTSALESGGIVLDRAPVDAAAVVQSALGPYRTAARGKGQRLVTQCAPGLYVDADEDRLCDAIANLVSNAVKYTPPCGTVTVRTERVGGEVQIAVADTGPGLSAEEQTELFQPFKTLTPRPTGGEASTGLGLSIVAQIVELHGGRIGVRSAPGEGSTFWISLPSLTRAPAEPSEAVGVA
jgi:signal transduction histidine kinase